MAAPRHNAPRPMNDIDGLPSSATHPPTQKSGHPPRGGGGGGPAFSLKSGKNQTNPPTHPPLPPPPPPRRYSTNQPLNNGLPHATLTQFIVVQCSAQSQFPCLAGKTRPEDGVGGGGGWLTKFSHQLGIKVRSSPVLRLSHVNCTGGSGTE